MKNTFKRLLAFGSALLLVGWLAAPYTAGQNLAPDTVAMLGDVNLTSISDGQVLVWSASAGEWQNATKPSVASGSGTTNALIKFDASDDLQDTNLIEGGAPAAGASGNVLTMDETYNAMDGSDTVAGFYFDATNYDSANHTGSTNVFSMIDIEGITQDAEASEYGIRFGSGWDNPIYFSDTSSILTGAGQVYYGSGTGTHIRVGATNMISLVTTTGTTIGSASLQNNQDFVDLTPAAIAVMDGSDTMHGLRLDFNANTPNHTGTGNTWNIISIDALTGDANANLNAILIGNLTGTAGAASEREIAINVGTGWDSDLNFQDTSAIVDFNTQLSFDSDAGGTTNVQYMLYDGVNNDAHRFIANTIGYADVVLISSTATAMNGSDTQAALRIAWTKGDDSGTGNTLNLIDIDALTGDAEANLNAINIGALTGTTGAAGEVETAINIGAGWDKAIWISDGGAGDDELVFGTDSDVTLTWYDASGFFIDASEAGGDTGHIYLDTDAGGAGTINMRGASGTSNLVYDPYNASNTGMDMLGLVVTAVNATDGSDIINMLLLDWNETDWATATETLNGILIDDITQDAQGTYNAIHVEAGWDAVLVSDITNSLFATGNNGQFIFREEVGGNTLYTINASASGDRHQFVGHTGLVINTNLASFTTTLAAQNGGDTSRGLFVDLTNGAHTGAANYVYGLEIDDITGDAQALEAAIYLDTGWDVGLDIQNAYTAITAVGDVLVREEFDRPYKKVEEDFTAAVLTDGGENLVLSYGNNLAFEYRLEQEHTTDAFVVSAGGLNIDGDATENEGVEIYLGDDGETTTGWMEIGTDVRCFEVNVTIADISETDQFMIGWRGVAAFDAANNYANYAEFVAVGIMAGQADGSIYAQSNSAAGGAGNDDSNTNWGDTETKTLKACIASDRTPDLYLDGTRITLTAQGSGGAEQALTASTLLNPFISFLKSAGDASPDPGVVINYWEITAHSDGN